MEIIKSGSQPSGKGPTDWFTEVVRVAPNEKHWHGATATTAMTHIAIQEQLDGKGVTWMEKVSDEQYSGKARGS